MVGKFINIIVYKIYLLTRRYLLENNNLVKKEDFDYLFWGDGV